METIKFDAIDFESQYEVGDILEKLIAIKTDHRKSLKDPDCHLNSLIGSYVEYEKEVSNNVELRREKWKKCLFKFYKMTTSKRNNEGKIISTKYIFPYDILNSNGLIACLLIDTDQEYMSNLKKTTFFVDEALDCDITLEEITEKEFRNIAEESCKSIVDKVLAKVVTKENEIEYFRKNGLDKETVSTKNG